MTVVEVSKWLASTAPSLAIQNIDWIVPAVQTVHILAICGALSSMAMLDLRLMGLAGRRHSLEQMARRCLPALWLALVVLLGSGVVLIVGEPERELMNPAFRWKMVLLVAAIGVTALVQRTLRGDPGFWETPGRLWPSARIVAATSLSLWLTVAVLGRWIAYVDPAHGL